MSAALKLAPDTADPLWLLGAIGDELEVGDMTSRDLANMIGAPVSKVRRELIGAMTAGYVVRYRDGGQLLWALG